jgi:hypothetical protein
MENSIEFSSSSLQLTLLRYIEYCKALKQNDGNFDANNPASLMLQIKEWANERWRVFGKLLSTH